MRRKFLFMRRGSSIIGRPARSRWSSDGAVAIQLGVAWKGSGVMGNSARRCLPGFSVMLPLPRPSNVLAALSAAIFLTGCDVACLKNPVSRERALKIAREYLLTRTMAEFEAGPSYLKRFAKALRDDGIDDAALRRIASAQYDGWRHCASHSNFYEVNEDPIALQGYLVHLKERVPSRETPDAFTVRMLVVGVSYCGAVFGGDWGPSFDHSDDNYSRDGGTSGCR